MTKPFSVTVHFKRKEHEWKLNIAMPHFNAACADNHKKLRRAVCVELEQKGAHTWKQFMQRIEVR